MKKIIVLGSTGSIGRNTLAVASKFPKRFKVIGLSANTNTDALLQQARRFRPKFLCLGNEESSLRLSRKLGASVKVLSGISGLVELAANKEADIIVFAISGSYAAIPLLEAMRRGKKVALANKESLVMAGEIIIREKKRHKGEILPVDSEQSAIWQCLSGNSSKALRKIYITASGGPLYSLPKAEFRRLTPKMILRHPKWKMGHKISVDSATLMNKGLEVIEARWLFEVDIKKIAVLIHPEVVVHSMCEFCDGSVLAQLADCDMKLPIQYALSFPERLKGVVRHLDFLKLRNLTFLKPDEKKFPCLRFAYDAAFEGGNAPCVLNAANEEAVGAFLGRRITFEKIPHIIEKVLSKKRSTRYTSLSDILEADQWARFQARRLIR